MYLHPIKYTRFTFTLSVHALFEQQRLIHAIIRCFYNQLPPLVKTTYLVLSKLEKKYTICNKVCHAHVHSKWEVGLCVRIAVGGACYSLVTVQPHLSSEAMSFLFMHFVHFQCVIMYFVYLYDINNICAYQ